MDRLANSVVMLVAWLSLYAPGPTVHTDITTHHAVHARREISYLVGIGHVCRL